MSRASAFFLIAFALASVAGCILNDGREPPAALTWVVPRDLPR